MAVEVSAENDTEGPITRASVSVYSYNSLPLRRHGECFCIPKCLAMSAHMLCLELGIRADGQCPHNEGKDDG